MKCNVPCVVLIRKPSGGIPEGSVPGGPAQGSPVTCTHKSKYDFKIK